MKFLILALCALGCACAPVDNQVAEVLRSEQSSSPDGGFSNSYETSNGIVSQSQGVVRTLENGEVVLEITGSNQYKTEDGKDILLTYIANEKGYQPKGEHLPTPPPPQPIPEYIKKAIEYIAAHPYKEKTQ